MKQVQMSQAQGKLLTAVAGGGEEALWRLARAGGPLGELAAEAIELYTNPHHDLTPFEAVKIVARLHNPT